MVDRYVESLCREMEFIAGNCAPETIFFGGGTPSILNLRQWRRVLEAMERHGLTGAGEWTVECNPATVSADKAKVLCEAGVNRISMGVQTFDEGLLDRIGRIHSREQIFRSVEILRAAGIDNLNLDLMFAMPTQTMEQWRASLREVAAKVSVVCSTLATASWMACTFSSERTRPRFLLDLSSSAVIEFMRPTTVPARFSTASAVTLSDAISRLRLA